MNKTLEFMQAQVGKDASNSPSPVMRWLNPTLLAVEEGMVDMVYTIRQDMSNPWGNLHGGITAAIVDDAIGAAMYTFGETTTNYVTINNSIDYFGAMKIGEQIRVQTKVVKKGRLLSNVQCSIWDIALTRLVAQGYSSLIKTESEESPTVAPSKAS